MTTRYERKGVAEWQAELAQLDETIAEIAAAGSSSVTAFGRTDNAFTLGELRAQRRWLVRMLNAEINSSSLFGTVRYT